MGAGTSEVPRSCEISLCEPVNHRTRKLPEKSQCLKNKAFGGDFNLHMGLPGACGFDFSPDHGEFRV